MSGQKKLNNQLMDTYPTISEEYVRVDYLRYRVCFKLFDMIKQFLIVDCHDRICH